MSNFDQSTNTSKNKKIEKQRMQLNTKQNTIVQKNKEYKTDKMKFDIVKGINKTIDPNKTTGTSKSAIKRAKKKLKIWVMKKIIPTLQEIL